MFALKKVATVLCVVVFTLWVPGLAVSALADDDVGPPDEAGMGLSEVEEVGDDAASGWHLNGEVFTTAPVEVGGAVQLETPGRFRLTTSLGVLPNTYIDAAHDLAVGAEVYDAQTAAFISNSLKSSLIWRAHAGWRPFPSLGLYVEGGYALMNIGGGVATTDVVEAVIGQSISGDYGAFNVDATFHMVDAEIGWQVHFWDVVSLRAAVGISAAFKADVSVTADVDAGTYQGEVDDITQRAADEFSRAYASKLIIPTASIALGVRFF